MSVMEANTIDIVVPANGDGFAELIIVDPLPWKIDEGDHLVALQSKINTYLAFVESGQLVEDFPQTKGRKIILKINALHPPSAEGEKFLSAVRPVIAQLKLELAFDLWSRERLGPNFPWQ
jgi:hypothetical protein